MVLRLLGLGGYGVLILCLLLLKFIRSEKVNNRLDADIVLYLYYVTIIDVHAAIDP